MAGLLLSVLMLSLFLVSAVPHSLNNLSHHHLHQHQQQLLLQFKAAAVSNNDTLLPDWTPLHHFCNWSAVTCHYNSHSVRAINLSRMGFDGTISPVLGNLSSLRSIDLSQNSLTATIPPELSLLTNLKYLYLGSNFLTGTISPELGNLHHLRALDLSYNNLTGTIPPQLGQLQHLRILALHHNELQGTIPPALSACRSLSELALSDNHLHGTIPPELSLLTSLNTLYLAYNNLTGTIPSSFVKLSALVELDLGENELYGTIPSYFGNMSALTAFIIEENHLQGPIPPELGMLTHLEALGLWGNQLSGTIPKSLGNCTSLKQLLLNDNQLGGTVPMELGNLNLLTYFIIHTNQLVSDSSNTLDFITALTNCSQLLELAITYNNFTGILPPSIGRLSPNLYFMSLGGNMISGSIPPQITNLTNLNVLDLSLNRLTGKIPSGIRRFRKLERLGLGRNKLEGSIPSEIGQMHSLGLLLLSGNQLSGKIPDSLCSSQQLRRVYLHHNNLSGNIPVSLKECQKLELLDMSYNKLRGSIPRDVIASLSNLQFYLNLSWNSLEGSLPHEIGKLLMVQEIQISGSQLSGDLPYSLGDCTALQLLNLSHNAFEGPIPGSLSKLKNLQEMDLSFNNLSGQIREGGLFPNRSVVTLFMGNPGLCGPKNYSLPPCPIQTQKKRSSMLKKLGLPVGGTVAFLLCCFTIGILWRLKLSMQLVRPSSFTFSRLGFPKFSYQDLVIATSGFDESNLLGVGNFGSVYKGISRDGKIIAIKTLNLQNEEALKSFKRECKMLGRIRHRNLIRIISAFCYPDLKGLILEFACNGSLENLLHPGRDDEGFCRLGLTECLNIAVDVAYGMEYLHHDSPLQIVHCDLKPSNVLLDTNMTALVTDFGISRLTSTNSIDSLSTTTFALKGSIGYVAPEYGLGGNVSIKGDVYSFGILILEMVTRKRPSHEMFVDDMSLHKWVRSAFPNRLAEMVDSELLRDVNENMEDNKCLLSFIHVGLVCSVESPRERPSIRDVAKALETLKTSIMGGAAASNLRATISELLERANPTDTLASDSSSF